MQRPRCRAPRSLTLQIPTSRSSSRSCTPRGTNRSQSSLPMRHSLRPAQRPTTRRRRAVLQRSASHQTRSGPILTHVAAVLVAAAVGGLTT